jgi:hypothetical protein
MVKKYTKKLSLSHFKIYGNINTLLKLTIIMNLFPIIIGSFKYRKLWNSAQAGPL